MRRLVLLLSLLLCVASVSGQEGTILDIAGQRPRQILVTLGEAAPPDPPADSAMGRALVGVLTELVGRDLTALRATATEPGHPLVKRIDAERLCVLHVSNRRGTKRVAVGRLLDGSSREMLVAWDLDGDDRRVTPVRIEPFMAMLASWPKYRGGFGATAEPLGEVIELDKPYTPGWPVLDEEAMKDRIFHGRSSRVIEADRRLADERLWARLPTGYDPKHPAGLLVWVSPMPDGRPPGVFAQAADELGFIIVGANDSGNNRLVSDRYQLALDGVATISARYHVDPKRVYVTGMSGGGRIASILAACFPDTFTGSIPIVGMSCYKPVPMGTGKYERNLYTRPASKLFRLFRSHRLAAITGLRDFNHEPVVAACRILKGDGVDARVFDDDTMAHEMPTPERFAEALRWVDEPYAKARERQRRDAQRLLDAYTKRFKDQPAKTESQRRMLERVTAAGPWTEQAWRAIELLTPADESQTKNPR